MPNFALLNAFSCEQFLYFFFYNCQTIDKQINQSNDEKMFVL